MNTIQLIREFGRELQTSLYQYGYAGAGMAISNNEDPKELPIAIAYLVGYADACRLACPYGSAHYKAADLIGNVARSMNLYLWREAEEGSDLSARMAASIEACRASLAAIKEQYMFVA